VISGTGWCGGGGEGSGGRRAFADRKAREREKEKEKKKKKRGSHLSPGVAEALSHSFYRANRRRRRQRERRLSIFTSNEFELKTTLSPRMSPHPSDRDRHSRA